MQPLACLDVMTDDGHCLHVELFGRRNGQPAVVLHGGPGSGLSRNTAAWFDLDQWLVVLFDQRGCGRSRPHVADVPEALTTITMARLLADLEHLRTALRIDRWLVVGGSWGATLAQAYAAQHADRVQAVALRAVTTTSRREVAWFTHGLRAFLPEAWEAFRAAVPEASPDALPACFAGRLADEDPAVHAPAAAAWCAWEQAVAGLGAGAGGRYADPRFSLGFARQVTHAWANAAWLEDGALARAAARHRLPCVMVHGRHDLGSPVATAFDLARAWPGSQLVVLPGAGHGSGDPGMASAMAAAIAGLAARN